MATITEQLGEFAASISLDRLPDEVIEKAKSCLLWGIGVALSTDESYANNTVARQMAADVASVSPSVPGTGSTVLLNGVRTSPAEATFANAVLFDQTMGDSYLAAAHFAPTVLPTTLAVAENEGRSGAEVLAAIVAGYEVAAAITKDHLARCMDPGWRPRIFDGFGAAAAAARLMRLDTAQTADAIGFAAGSACGSIEPMYARSMENGFTFGIAARNGLTGALLARTGARAAKTAVEGKAGFLIQFAGTTEFKDAITAQLGGPYEILNVTFKRFEASGRAHTPMLLALRLAQEVDLKPSEIEAVELELNAFEEAYPPRRERIDAHMLEGVAGALTYRSGRADLIVHHDNPVFLRVVDRITTRPVAELGPYCARLTVKTATGQYVRELTDGPRNHTFDYAGTLELARGRLKTMRISRATLDELAAQIRTFETAPNVHALIALTTRREQPIR
jgi:hypothetical protein